MKIHSIWDGTARDLQRTVVDWAKKSPDLISPTENAFICGALDFHKEGQ